MKTAAITKKNRLSKKSPIFLSGPTGVGKSSFAIELALQLDGEVIGADAFQIYKGIPLLTAQPSLAEQAKVPHHLIASLAITETSDAVYYRRMALPIIDQIIACDKTPLITGGTGFYLKALISPLDPLPTADLELRASFTAYSLEALILRLKELDPTALDLLDLKNRRRVERALEIIIQTGKPLSETRHRKNNDTAQGLLLVREREELYQRIEKNVQMIFDLGVVDEIAHLDNITISSTASMTLGLREIQALRRGEITTEKAMSMITQATKKYAKRQLTWFKNQHNFTLLNLSHFSSTQAAINEAVQLLSI